jgi:hypothetical protein
MQSHLLLQSCLFFLLNLQYFFFASLLALFVAQDTILTQNGQNNPFLLSLFDIGFGRSESKRIWVINSGLGTGKTYCAAQIIHKACCEKKNVLVITPRISFAETFGPRIQEEFGTQTSLQPRISFKYTLYNQVNNKKELKISRNLIIQVESLHYLLNENGTNIEQRYDLVVIDEVVAVLRQFNSPNTQGYNLVSNSKAFEQILKGAKKVLMMDGFVTPAVGIMLKEMGLEYQLVMNPYIKARGEAIEVSTNDQFIGDMMQGVLENNKKIFCPIASKELAQSLLKTYSEKLSSKQKIVKVFTGDDGDDIKRQNAMNVNQEWKADLLLTTPVNTVGMNFTEEWYDEKYVYGCYCSCDPATMAQMSDRVRGIRGKKLFFHTRECPHENAYNICTLDSIQTALESKVTIFKTLKDELDLKDVDWKVAPSWLKTLFHYLKLRMKKNKE